MSGNINAGDIVRFTNGRQGIVYQVDRVNRTAWCSIDSKDDLAGGPSMLAWFDFAELRPVRQ